MNSSGAGSWQNLRRKSCKDCYFGAFVNFLGSKDGLVHISELAENRVNKVTDVVNEGDLVNVKVLGVDDRGKVRLSIKAVTADENSDGNAQDKEDA